MRGLIESFAVPPAGAAPMSHAVDLAASCDADVLVAVLEEAIYLVDARGLVTTRVHVDDRPDGGAGASFDCVALADVEIVGSMPKGIARHALRIAADAKRWTCTVVVDV